jgi:hypothetical protein
MIGGAKNKLRSTILTLILTPLNTNTQYVYRFGCTLLNPTQILLNYFFTQNNSFKAKSQISNLNRTQPGKRGQQSPKATGAAKQNSAADGEEKNTTETGMWIEEQMQHKNP